MPSDDNKNDNTSPFAGVAVTNDTDDVKTVSPAESLDSVLPSPPPPPIIQDSTPTPMDNPGTQNSPPAPNISPTSSSEDHSPPPPPPQFGGTTEPNILPETPASETGNSASEAPQMVTTTGGSGSSKKKFSKKFILPILAGLLLVGGVAAGVVLVQQQQDIREKAAGDWCNPDPNGTDYGSPCQCNEGVVGCTDHGSDGKVTQCRDGNNQPANAGTWHATNECFGDPPSTGGGGNFDLYVSGSCIKADNTTDGTILVRKACFVCSGTANDGCNDQSGDYLRGCGFGDVTVSPGVTGQNIICVPGDLAMCENYQVDAHVVSGASDSDAIVGQHDIQGDACNTVITASCLNVKAYDSDWNELSQADLTTLKAGDVVNFSVAGTASEGTFTEARFNINGGNGEWRSPVSAKVPGTTDEFYDTYTIPVGVTTFSISAQVNHDTEGWK